MTTLRHDIAPPPAVPVLPSPRATPRATAPPAGTPDRTTPAFLPVAAPALDGPEAAYVADCLASGWVSSTGTYVQRFERDFAAFCDVRHAATAVNGTAALHLALAALGVGPGDEVIVPTLTYISTANAVRYCGATPVFADVDASTMNIDPRHVAALVGERTCGVIAVHLYGHPADTDALRAVTGRHGLFLLEDAAEAHGARVRGRPVGSLGDAAAFSFFGNKIITTGEGGMVTTADTGLDERVRLLRGQGMDPHRRYHFPEIGYNYRLTNMAAALGVAQLERIGAFLARRAAIGRAYDDALASLAGEVLTPAHAPWAEPVAWLYTVRLAHADRDDVAARMLGAGVETRPVFAPVHAQPPYGGTPASHPVAARLAREGLSLPTHVAMTTADVDRVVGALRGALQAADG